MKKATSRKGSVKEEYKKRVVKDMHSHCRANQNLKTGKGFHWSFSTLIVHKQMIITFHY